MPLATDESDSIKFHLQKASETKKELDDEPSEWEMDRKFYYFHLEQAKAYSTLLKEKKNEYDQLKIAKSEEELLFSRQAFHIVMLLVEYHEKVGKPNLARKWYERLGRFRPLLDEELKPQYPLWDFSTWSPEDGSLIQKVMDIEIKNINAGKQPLRTRGPAAERLLEYGRLAERYAEADTAMGLYRKAIHLLEPYDRIVGPWGHEHLMETLYLKIRDLPSLTKYLLRHSKDDPRTIERVGLISLFSDGQKEAMKHFKSAARAHLKAAGRCEFADQQRFLYHQWYAAVLFHRIDDKRSAQRYANRVLGDENGLLKNRYIDKSDRAESLLRVYRIIDDDGSADELLKREIERYTTPQEPLSNIEGNLTFFHQWTKDLESAQRHNQRSRTEYLHLLEGRKRWYEGLEQAAQWKARIAICDGRRSIYDIILADAIPESKDEAQSILYAMLDALLKLDSRGWYTFDLEFYDLYELLLGGQ